MPWWGWLLLSVAGLVVVLAIALRALRASQRGRRFLALGLRAKLRCGHLLLRDREVPVLAKLILALLVGYLALPVDLIPDFIPVLGQLDDGLVIAVAIGLLIFAVPRERFEAALRQAEAEQEERRLARTRPAGSPRENGQRRLRPGA